MDDKTTPRPWYSDNMANVYSPTGVSLAIFSETSADVVCRMVGAETLPAARRAAALIVKAVNSFDAHQELVTLCTGILDCLEQGDLWKKPARLHAAGLLRKAMEKAKAAHDPA
jgi:hypothetical protein